MNFNHCVFYVVGLLAALAYDEISFNKIATQSHNPVSGTGYDASNAVDGNTATCMRTDIIGGFAQHNTVWWKVDLGGVYNIYSIHILYKNYPGYGCNNVSIYGSNCDTPCPTNCKDNTCSIQSGACFNCKPGWTGIYCNIKCGEGWYGKNCSQPCVGHCRDRATCNHVTGQCDKGCAAGWTGLQCIEECNDGNYGYDCVNNCSNHCFNDSPCNKQTGHCDRGCKPGYTNNDCNNECPLGLFGITCRERCSGHCINNEPCDHVSGMCPSGCQDGYIGAYCNNACKEGYFGTNCSRVCSPKCKSDTCRHTDGSCTTCDAGYTGFNCSKACAQSYGDNCRQPCSLQCYNKTCDRFTGRCLLGCKDGFNGELCDRENVIKIQSMSIPIMFILGLSASVLINFILIVCGILLCRRNKTRKLDVFGNLLSCWNRSIYQDIVVKNEEASTYQELDLSGNTYQNTAV